MMSPVLSIEPWMIEPLERLVRRFWDGTTVVDLVLQINTGDILAWVPVYAPKTLVLTQIIDHPRGRELYLYGLAGAGIIKVADQFVADLQMLARVNGCFMIGASAIVPGWDKIAKRLGFKPVATQYMMEL